MRKWINRNSKKKIAQLTFDIAPYALEKDNENLAITATNQKRCMKLRGIIASKKLKIKLKI